jgi:hypothetical protein
LHQKRSREYGLLRVPRYTLLGRQSSIRVVLSPLTLLEYGYGLKGGTSMEKQSRFAYADTIARLSKAIADAGNTIFATIDQAQARKRSG